MNDFVKLDTLITAHLSAYHIIMCGGPGGYMILSLPYFYALSFSNAVTLSVLAVHRIFMRNFVLK